MKHEQLPLFFVQPDPRVAVYDPAWDEPTFNVGEQLSCEDSPCKNVGEQVQLNTKKTAHQHDNDRWNPSDFGEVPYKCDGGQLTIFYEDSHEPPDPDDYQTIAQYEKAWKDWCDRVGEQVKLDTKKVAHQQDKPITHWVERYWVERGSSKLWYYRYTWMEGRKLHRHYIGSVRSPKANLKKQTVEDAIVDGQSPDEIIALIRQFRN